MYAISPTLPQPALQASRAIVSHAVTWLLAFMTILVASFGFTVVLLVATAGGRNP
jgi:hypothetical protein